MYGLVNKALEGLVCSRGGESAWEQVKAMANVNIDSFISMSPYPDQISYELVGATSKVLGIPAEEVLKDFGEYWILYTAREGYGDLLKMSGKNLKEFLLNLDNLHTHVGMSFPDLRPPSFRCTELEENSLTLHYHSERAGLAPMVVGLLHGLGQMLNTEVQVTQTADRAKGADHDEFLVNYQAR